MSVRGRRSRRWPRLPLGMHWAGSHRRLDDLSLSSMSSSPSPPADYKALKDLIKESAAEEQTAGPQHFSPRTTSLTVERAADRRDSGAATRGSGGQGARCAARPNPCFDSPLWAPHSPARPAPCCATPSPHTHPTAPPIRAPPAAEERFFQQLEGQVDKCGTFTARLVAELRERLKQLQARVATAGADAAARADLLEVSVLGVGGRAAAGRQGRVRVAGGRAARMRRA